MKKLYLELQSELDKLDCLRKNWSYFTLKREEYLKTIAIQQLDEGVDMACDGDNPVHRSPLHRC